MEGSVTMNWSKWEIWFVLVAGPLGIVALIALGPAGGR